MAGEAGPDFVSGATWHSLEINLEIGDHFGFAAGVQVTPKVAGGSDRHTSGIACATFPEPRASVCQAKNSAEAHRAGNVKRSRDFKDLPQLVGGEHGLRSGDLVSAGFGRANGGFRSKAVRCL